MPEPVLLVGVVLGLLALGAVSTQFLLRESLQLRRILPPQVGGSPPAGKFDTPTKVTLDAQGNIYVADQGNDRVQNLSPAAQPLALWGR